MTATGFAVVRCDYDNGRDGPRTNFVVREMVRTLDEAQAEVVRLNDREAASDVYYFWKAAHAFPLRPER
jgi:hypothetical protein